MTDVPQSNHVLLRDRRFHYLEWSGPHRDTVVFLHGAGLNGRTWRGVCEHLRAGYRCIALDLRGHGDSEWANDLDYSPRSHAGDVSALIAHLGLVRPALVGMSLGGTVALAHATEHEVRALVVIDTGPELESTGRAQLVDFFLDPNDVDTFEGFVNRLHSLYPRRGADELREGLTHNLIELPDGRWTWKYDRRQYRFISMDQRDRWRRETWSDARRLTCPVLVVRGARSRVLTRDTAKALATRFPAGRFVEIAGAGHNVQHDQPALLASEIAAFLGAVS